MNPFPHQQRADRSLRPGARTLRSRHSILVQVAGNGVRRLSLRPLPQNRLDKRSHDDILPHGSIAVRADRMHACVLVLADRKKILGTGAQESRG
jgi:hypothetical protein